MAVTAATESRKFTKKQIKKTATREKILGEARALFKVLGYGGTTIRHIAARVGMSTGAVFASFASKTDLFAAILEEEFQAYQAHMEPFTHGPGGASAMAERLCRADYAFRLERKNVFGFGIPTELASQESVDATLIEKFDSWLVHLISVAIEQNGPRFENKDFKVTTVVNAVINMHLGGSRRWSATGTNEKAYGAYLRAQFDLLFAGT